VNTLASRLIGNDISLASVFWGSWMVYETTGPWAQRSRGPLPLLKRIVSLKWQDCVSLQPLYMSAVSWRAWHKVAGAVVLIKHLLAVTLLRRGVDLPTFHASLSSF